LENLGVGGIIILKWNFKKRDGVIGWIDQAQDVRLMAGCCECSDELPGSIKCGEFLD
jgi:hypothetical protein